MEEKKKKPKNFIFLFGGWLVGGGGKIGCLGGDVACTKKGAMNTKTMRLPPRRVLTQTNKRKEREGFDGVKQPSITKLPKPKPTTTFQSGSKDPASSNQLLAGYLAHEFLTQGTLFGQPWDPARAEAVPVSVSSTLDLRKGKPTQTQTQIGGAEPEPESTTSGRRAEPPQLENYQRYVELANLLKTDGAHLAGIVNPTQLARLLQM